MRLQVGRFSAPARPVQVTHCNTSPGGPHAHPPPTLSPARAPLNFRKRPHHGSMLPTRLAISLCDVALVRARMDRGAASALFDRPHGRRVATFGSRYSRALSDMMGQDELPLAFLHAVKRRVELSASIIRAGLEARHVSRAAARRLLFYPLPHMFSLHFYDARARRDRRSPPSQRRGQTAMVKGTAYGLLVRAVRVIHCNLCVLEHCFAPARAARLCSCCAISCSAVVVEMAYPPAPPAPRRSHAVTQRSQTSNRHGHTRVAVATARVALNWCSARRRYPCSDSTRR